MTAGPGMTDKSGPRPGGRARAGRGAPGGARIAAGTGPRWADGACGGGARVPRRPSIAAGATCRSCWRTWRWSSCSPSRRRPTPVRSTAICWPGWNSTSTKCPRCPGAPCCATCWARRATKGPGDGFTRQQIEAIRERAIGRGEQAAEAEQIITRGGAAHVWRAVRQPGAERRQDAGAGSGSGGRLARRRGVNPRAVIRAKLENVHFHF